MKSWKCLFILFAVFAAFSLRAMTFSQRHLPVFGPSNAVAFTLQARDSNLGGHALGGPAHVPHPSVSLAKIFVYHSTVSAELFPISHVLSEGATQTPSSYIPPTSSRPPSC